mmetsp:Transcript_14700/g.57673  ORF Transcript_14700/g.57673 Transcript_14700/m.57673 type:complete len:400 (+) Transcript_14700:868-2067(+)
MSRVNCSHEHLHILVSLHVKNQLCRGGVEELVGKEERAVAELWRELTGGNLRDCCRSPLVQLDTGVGCHTEISLLPVHTDTPELGHFDSARSELHIHLTLNGEVIVVLYAVVEPDLEQPSSHRVFLAILGAKEPSFLFGNLHLLGLIAERIVRAEQIVWVLLLLQLALFLPGTSLVAGKVADRDHGPLFDCLAAHTKDAHGIVRNGNVEPLLGPVQDAVSQLARAAEHALAKHMAAVLLCVDNHFLHHRIGTTCSSARLRPHLSTLRHPVLGKDVAAWGEARLVRKQSLLPLNSEVSGSWEAALHSRGGSSRLLDGGNRRFDSDRHLARHSEDQSVPHCIGDRERHSRLSCREEGAHAFQGDAVGAAHSGDEAVAVAVDCKHSLAGGRPVLVLTLIIRG